MYRTINNFFGVGLMLSASGIWLYVPEKSFIINSFLFLGFFLIIGNEIIVPIIARQIMKKKVKDNEK